MRQGIEGGSKPHYPGEVWADFVRGLAGEAVSREIRSHLDAGCADCQAAAGKFQAVHSLATTDRQMAVPEDVVREARELFRPVRSSGWIDALEAVVGELIASAGSQWQMAGVRSLEGIDPVRNGNRLLYRAGEYSVDLKLDPPGSGAAGELIGQISNDRDPDETLSDILVQTVVLGKTLGETATNRFGEFVMDYPSHPNTLLRFAMRERGRRIDLPLNLVDSPEGTRFE